MAEWNPLLDDEVYEADSTLFVNSISQHISRNHERVHSFRYTEDESCPLA